MIIRRPITSTSDVLRIGGGFTAAFSLAMGLLVLFSPFGCTFVGSLQLLVLSFLFIIGGLIFFLGQALIWKKR
jgi:hypothetical protein